MPHQHFQRHLCSRLHIQQKIRPGMVLEQCGGQLLTHRMHHHLPHIFGMNGIRSTHNDMICAHHLTQGQRHRLFITKICRCRLKIGRRRIKADLPAFAHAQHHQIHRRLRGQSVEPLHVLFASVQIMHFAKRQKKVLYLNLEKYGSSDCFFSGMGSADMSDVIFALKSKKPNLATKLESYVKVDQSGVRFYSQAKIALDMIELGKDETLQLINELRQTGGYDYLILDMDFGLDQNTLAIYREAHSVVLVGDGSAISTRKTERAYAALATLEQYSNDPLSDKMCYANNKGNPSQTVNIPDLRVIGSAPAFQGVGVQQMLSQMSMQAFFENIL